MSETAVIAITGAAGFIGSAFARRARGRGLPVRRFVRQRVESDADPDVIAIDLARTDVNELAHRLAGVVAVV
ncbi:MAG TPA: NAD-dependent epimerase/dehydratase family protein, partial [Casimicrobiaceae bacterium]